MVIIIGTKTRDFDKDKGGNVFITVDGDCDITSKTGAIKLKGKYQSMVLSMTNDRKYSNCECPCPQVVVPTVDELEKQSLQLVINMVGNMLNL